MNKAADVMLFGHGSGRAAECRTLVMGILNVTPDSFSDGGAYVEIPAAVERARQMIAEGADILDIGGESTRPGAEPVSSEEEQRRVLPVIRALREAGIAVPISIDTYRADTAREAMLAGATVLNDIWGLQHDPDMAAVAVQFGCPIVLMHNRKQAVYANFIHDVVEDLRLTVERAHKAGIRDEQIVLDPGIGFAKSYEQNLQLMNELHRITALGYPVLLGTSRKSMIRRTLNLPTDELLEGTAATVALGIGQGCRIVRVHDVRAMRRVADMTDAILSHRISGDDASRIIPF
ncbi:dihydropteroate synthase [Paenibacillus sp. UNCCL117]|uniref:dihydropteroate synthase n=1 Tax=unclassified Paenibacillus TaxID=185978 RepID=UPI000883C5FC|nr:MULTISPECIES: dihydropteroate synthase [unclassified Paenibacillus]SDE54563.1 dihydropteroate synthase [Paenibacillus sp. cl123]SFW68232.1 dihydropteroate synthase [Paenibacillus sp. UNCCL117]